MKNPTTEQIVKGLLDDLYGAKDSHKEIADELVVKYNNARGSLISVLKYLNFYKSQDML